MRHRVYGRHLGRDKNQRTALFRSLVSALFLNGSIQTTEPKAKSIKSLVDKIITQAKDKNTQRLVSQFLTQKNVQEKLFKEIVPGTKGRNSGYTSIVRLGQRLGDSAMNVRMTLLMEEKKAEAPKKEVKAASEVKEVALEKSKPAKKVATKKVTK